jgi:hypothetical protein
MRHKILVIEGATGTGKTAYARSKGTHSRMCNVWNVASLTEDANVWILDDMVSTSGKYSLKALSQYEADFTGRYQRVKTMKVRLKIILGNSRAAITRCWEDISGPEREEWVEKNMDPLGQRLLLRVPLVRHCRGVFFLFIVLFLYKQLSLYGNSRFWGPKETKPLDGT